jgi:hypothetical protein
MVGYRIEARRTFWALTALGARWAEGSSVSEARLKIVEAVFEDVGAFTT